MPLVSFRDEYFRELETFFKGEPRLMKENKLETLDHFIEEVAMFGLTKYRCGLLSHDYTRIKDEV